jgi:hypothetical protein
MYFNHATVGAIAIKPVLDRCRNKFTEKENTVLWFAGITSAVLPDFDIAYSVLRGLEDHRSFVTHGIILYIIAFILLYSISFFQKREVFGRKFFKTLALVFLVGISTHFLIDFFFGGIALLAPFTFRIFGFDMSIKNGYQNRLIEYVFSNYMIVEIFITLLFFYLFKENEYFVPKIFGLTYFLTAVTAFTFTSLFLF